MYLNTAEDKVSTLARRVGAGVTMKLAGSLSSSQLRYRYGNVFSLQLAWSSAIVVSGPAAVREVLVEHREDTSDRPPSPSLEHLGFGPRSEGK